MRLADQKLKSPKLPSLGPGPMRPQQKGSSWISQRRGVPSWVFPPLPLCDVSFSYSTLSAVTLLVFADTVSGQVCPYVLPRGSFSPYPVTTNPQ